MQTENTLPVFLDLPPVADATLSQWISSVEQSIQNLHNQLDEAHRLIRELESNTLTLE